MIKALRFILSIQEKALRADTLSKSRVYHVVQDKAKYWIICFLSLLILGFSFLFNSPLEILQGLGAMILVPGILITDFMAVANIGAALFNSGILMILCIAIARLNKVSMSGPVIAAIFTVGGFGLFGKTLINIWPIIGGVFLYARYRGERFNRYLLPAFFGTALGPLTSQIAFGFDFLLVWAVPFAILAGLLAGFCLPAMANHFVVFHQGYNLYNIGFTCGILGLAAMALFRAFGFETAATQVVMQTGSDIMNIGLLCLFIIMLLIGLFFTREWLQSQKLLNRQPGRLVSDFVSSEGFGPVLINMALLGLLSMGYVLLVNGVINGPVIGGIFTVVGFGAFGKHLRNVMPIFIGVYLATLTKIWEPDATSTLLAALFGTTLAPIAGTYGWPYGVIAGFLHMSIVMNVGYLHGGMNLYNNGFAGGFVAAILIPVFDAIRSRFHEKKTSM